MTALAIHLPQYEKRALCAECGGNCCKHYPGLLHPADVGAPNRVAMLHRLVERLVTGLYCVDVWESDDEIKRDTYFVRPAFRGDEGVTVHFGWWGACALLTPGGCSLKHDARPYGCRALEPEPKHLREKQGCTLHGGSKADQVRAWAPYGSVIRWAARALGQELRAPPSFDDDEESLVDRAVALVANTKGTS